MTTASSRTDAQSLEEAVPGIALDIARLDPGPAAALRRGPHFGAGSAAMWRLLARHNPIGADRNPSGWASLIQSLAILTARGRSRDKLTAHEPTMTVGRALEESGFSESRLARLLSARGRTRQEAAVRMCRRLEKGHRNRIDGISLARFVLHQDDATDSTIAREYYRAERKRLAKKENEKA